MIAGIAGLLSIAGTVVSMVGQYKQADAAKKAEKLKQRQMQLEAMRQRREQIRRSQVARAHALAVGTNQGAGQSSALMGGMAQVQSEAGRNIQAVNQDEQIGNQIFSANRQYASAGFLTYLGGGISSLGGAIGSSAGTITRLTYDGQAA